MSFAATLLQLPVTALPFRHLLLAVVQLTLLGGVLMFFRPLLTGIARALLLLVWPHPCKAGRQDAAAEPAEVHTMGAPS